MVQGRLPACQPLSYSGFVLQMTTKPSCSIGFLLHADLPQLS